VAGPRRPVHVYKRLQTLVAWPQKGTSTGQKSNHQHVSCLVKVVISRSAVFFDHQGLFIQISTDRIQWYNGTEYRVRVGLMFLRKIEIRWNGYTLSYRIKMSHKAILIVISTILIFLKVKRSCPFHSLISLNEKCKVSLPNLSTIFKLRFELWTYKTASRCTTNSAKPMPSISAVWKTVNWWLVHKT
jgi:hypothetical protein